jgi:hypothetical protein
MKEMTEIEIRGRIGPDRKGQEGMMKGTTRE